MIKNGTIGIIGAMDVEVEQFKAKMTSEHSETVIQS